MDNQINKENFVCLVGKVIKKSVMKYKSKVQNKEFLCFSVANKDIKVPLPVMMDMKDIKEKDWLRGDEEITIIGSLDANLSFNHTTLKLVAKTIKTNSNQNLLFGSSQLNAIKGEY